jgi:hypothetical protein
LYQRKTQNEYCNHAVAEQSTAQPDVVSSLVLDDKTLQRSIKLIQNALADEKRVARTARAGVIVQRQNGRTEWYLAAEFSD